MLALTLAAVLATEGERPTTANVSGLYGFYVHSKPFKASFEIRMLSEAGEVVVPVSGSAACPKNCPMASRREGPT